MKTKYHYAITYTSVFDNNILPINEVECDEPITTLDQLNKLRIRNFFGPIVGFTLLRTEQIHDQGECMKCDHLQIDHKENNVGCLKWIAYKTSCGCQQYTPSI